MNYLSKSTIASLSCEYHCYHERLNPKLDALSIYNAARQTGIDFHDFMAAYLRYLIAEGRAEDPSWVLAKLEKSSYTADAKHMIADNMVNFTIDPEQTLGVELFLSIDAQGNPVEKTEAHNPGYRPPEGSRARYGGTLDWVLLPSETQVDIIDWKTAYTMVNVDEAEAAMYALLVFKHFLFAETVSFTWMFARIGTRKSVMFCRSEIESKLWPMVEDAYTHLTDVIKRGQSRQILQVNPLSGRCAYCLLRCPLSEGLGREIDIPPLKEADVAAKTALRLMAARMYAQRAEEALRQWIDVHGPLDMGHGFKVNVETQTVRKHPLGETLHTLGMELVPMCIDCFGKATIEVARKDLQGDTIEIRKEPCPTCRGTGLAGSITGKSPLYDVPLSRLTVGGLSAFSKAKKRAGLREALESKAIESHRSVLRIRRENDMLLGPGEDDDDNPTAT